MTLERIRLWIPRCQPTRLVTAGDPKETEIVFEESANLTLERGAAYDLSRLAVQLFQPSDARYPESSLPVLFCFIDATFGNAGRNTRSVNKSGIPCGSRIESIKSSVRSQPQCSSTILTDPLDWRGLLIGSFRADAIVRKCLCGWDKSVEKLGTANP